MKEEFRILSTTAILGYGFPVASFEEGMKRKPHLIAVDAGSTDPGPYYLGAGVSFTDRGAVKRDLELMLKAGVPNKIPVVIGSAGGSGADAHLAWCREIIEEIAREQRLHFKLALIHAQIDKPLVLEALAAGKVRPLEPAPELTAELVEQTSNIVAQMGVEPFVRAFDELPDVILAGRSYDPSVFAALAIRRGYDRGLALHLGKILECASICATPGSGSDCMFGYIGDDYFRVEPLNPIRKCTTLSVAAHTLYEKTNPYILPGPGGHLDLTCCKFEQETDSIVRVSGTVFVASHPYTIKLEGARPIGCRTVSIAGARDPIMISRIDDITKGVEERVADNFREKHWDYHLRFNIYGRDGVMSTLEPNPSTEGCHELGVIIEATAPTQGQADTICAFARSTMLHYGYEGRRATAGNLAFPYSPSDFHAGEVYVFSVYHLMEIDDPAYLFPIECLSL
ncbi:MAG: acyclic terpene utilization AtuA family protein [Sphaerochaetaceae bacterium]|nr:acyclic terpene utilization AtuA family protein [Sphaerochaetaceae bacterium]